MIVDLNERRRDQARVRKQRERKRERERVSRGEMPVTKEGHVRLSSYSREASVTNGVTEPVTGVWVTLVVFIAAFLLLSVELYMSVRVAWSQGATERDSTAFIVFAVGIDLLEFVLLTVASAFWRSRRWLSSVSACCIWCVCLVYSVNSSVGFAATNLDDTAKQRAERITPAVELAQRKRDTIAKSREDECKRRGDRCRELEALERRAFDDLEATQNKVAAEANPQASKAAALISSLSLAKLNAADMANFWLLLLAMLPHLGGFVLCWGQALWTARR